jgi:hypothetical protein
MYVDGLEKELEVEKLIEYARKSEVKLTEDELRLLNSKDKIEKKSLERLRKQLEIRELEQRIANLNFEKNIQQLKKNEDGTWEYQYVVDQDAIDEAEEQLRDKKLDLIKFEEDVVRNAEKEELDAKSEYFSDYKNIVDKALNGEITDFKAFSEALSGLNTDFLAGLSSESKLQWDGIFDNMKTNVDGMKTTFRDYVKDLEILAEQAEAALLKAQFAKEEKERIEQDKPSNEMVIVTKSGKTYNKDEFAALSNVEKAGILNHENPSVRKNGKEILISDIAGMSDKDLNDFFGLETGGYTGAWGKSGKLAMLHEKEIVLNKDDTNNMLNMLSVSRDMSTIFDANKLKNSLNLNTKASEQNFHINDLVFPNVTNSNEIQDAMKNLPHAAMGRVRTI